MFASFDHQNSNPNDNLPYIPPPDYSKTARQKFSPRRPSLPTPQTNGGEPKHSPKGQLAVFTDFLNQDHIVDLSNGKFMPSPDVNQPEPSPTEKKEEVHKRLLKMIQTQGVPVFPGLAPTKNLVKPQIKVASGPSADSHAHLGPTRAYIKHLENHRKFDTMNSFESCDKCPICRQMLDEIELLAAAKPRKAKSESLITSGKMFEPLTIFEEEEPEEFADDVAPNGVAPDYYGESYPSTSHSLEAQRLEEYREDEQSVRAKNDWEAEGRGQLSVRYGETLRVLKMGQEWICVRNNRGQSGWVPAQQLYLMPGGYF